MPSILFHYTFTLENKKVDRYQDVLNLAAQGPDVFGFYGFSFTKRSDKHAVRRFGSWLHHSDVSKAYYLLLEYSKKSEHKEMLDTYIYGSFMHYILDRNLHPYIFYRTGFDETGNAKGVYFTSHVAFEAYLDVKFAKEHQTLINPVNAVKTNENDVKIISKMFYEVSKELNYQGLNENSFYIAYKDMLLVQKVLYSRTGFKKALFNIFAHKSLLNAMALPLHITKYDYIDFLNKNKNEWKYPATGEVSSLSVEELYERAKSEQPKLDALFLKYNNNELTIDDVSKFVNRIDHDGNDFETIKKYSNICWNTSK